jgi:hypothetical protein
MAGAPIAASASLSLDSCMVSWLSLMVHSSGQKRDAQLGRTHVGRTHKSNMCA